MTGWEQDLLAFCGRADNKKNIHKHVVALRKKGVKLTSADGSTVDDEVEAKESIQKKVLPKLRAAIIERIPSMWRSQMFEQLGEPAITDDGEYEFSVRFNPSVVSRSSLYGNNSEQLNNVVAYLSHGAKPIKHSVFGSWDGHTKRGRYRQVKDYVYLPKGYTRASDAFLVNAVASLNQELKEDGITVVLGDAYLPK